MAVRQAGPITVAKPPHRLHSTEAKPSHQPSPIAAIKLPDERSVYLIAARSRTYILSPTS